MVLSINHGACKKNKEERKMEVAQSWRVRLSFKNATMVVTAVNIVIALLLLQGFLSSSASVRNNRVSSNQFASAKFSYIKESEEMRMAMQPRELIKRVKEIEQEAYTKPETTQKKDVKQTAAFDLSKRLKDIRSLNDAASLKALEDWRMRKMERARLRELERNGSKTSQT